MQELWLKIGGGLIRERGVFAGHYGNTTTLVSILVAPPSLLDSSFVASTFFFFL